MQKIKWGVIGAGGIARRRSIPGLLKARNCELVAVMDVVGAAEIAREFGVAKAYAREKELLEDPEVEAVYIASPVYLHLDQIAAAARAKKHILCEKPVARTLAETRKAIQICRKAGVFLQEGYMMKFHGAHAAIHGLIHEGRLGKIVSMRAQLSCWYPPMKGAWRQDPVKGGGGALIDMASHLYDLLEYFAGPIRQVAAFTDHLVHRYRSEDSATTLLRFRSGAHATVDTFFCIPDKAVPSRLEIYGSLGSILAEGTIGQGSGGLLAACFESKGKGYDVRQTREVKEGFQKIPFPQVNPYQAEFEYFASAIRNHREPVLNGRENALRTMTVVDAAYRSARYGRVVRIASKKTSRRSEMRSGK